MNAQKKATMQDLIAKAKGKESRELKTAEVYVKRLDATMTIQEPDQKMMEEYMAKMIYSKGDSAEINQQLNEKLVYSCVIDPKLSDPELRKGLKVSQLNATDVVRKIFEVPEILHLASRILELADVDVASNPVELVEDVKN
ncbi:phage tail assembly chaperone [Brevibacillus dissolubilis]|uniref:phage tail assembly chaperone n=1 Tax=Brevibacillus dissolubilis TaxID=1844116 RepID=UPI00111729C7|nr:hypothetical protein [Brevibacillus dissolubilis]